jgi:hypothetical protein
METRSHSLIQLSSAIFKLRILHARVRTSTSLALFEMSIARCRSRLDVEQS